MFPGEAARCNYEFKMPGMSYSHCRPLIFSYPVITRSVHVRVKWPVHSLVQELDFMAAVWRKRDKSLDSVCGSLLPLRTSSNRGCLAKELLVCLSKVWQLLWSVLDALKMIKRHLHRWMDCVLNLLNVFCVQRQCWWGAFYVSLS